MLEVAIMHVINHANIAKLFGYCDSPRCLLLQEYKCSLNQAIPTLTVEDTWKYVSDITNGLDIIHQMNIIHFDIKPSNNEEDGLI
jgi:serine/threonine protein kinase